MNAIILAAGMGTRLRPLTNDIPKCLVKVGGVPMVERQIQNLIAIGITDITLVSGYKAEKLDYLKDMYNVSIVYNDKYDVANNLYSLYLVRNKILNTYILEGDIYLYSNCFSAEVNKSTYFAKEMNFENEWELVVDESNKVIRINPNKTGYGYVMSGISFWNSISCSKLVELLECFVKEERYCDLFWDNIILEHCSEFDVYVQKCEGLFEIDTVEDLCEVEMLNKTNEKNSDCF